MYDRDFQNLGREAEQARKAAAAKAERWTEAQAERLDTSTKEILAAVRRGWLPEQIAGVTSKYALEDGPPVVGAVQFKVIREAPVKPARRSNAPQTHGWNNNETRRSNARDSVPQKHDRSNERTSNFAGEQVFAAQTGDASSAMAEAFRRAPFLQSK